VHVDGEGSVGVGADIDRALVVVVLGDRNALGSGELLFQVTGDGLLLLPSMGGGVLTRPCLIQGLACGSHSGDESLLLSMHDSDGGLSHGHGVLLLPLSGGGDLLLIDGEIGGVVQHGRQDGGGYGWWWVAVNPRVRLEMNGSEEKIDDSDYHIRERCGIKN
jgi:hypothetical protein